MKTLRSALAHAVTVLSLMFLTFIALDQFNPMMNFVDNGISTALLAALCVCGVAQSYLGKRE